MQPKQRTSVITYQRYFKVGSWRCILSVVHLSLRPHSYSVTLDIYIKNVSHRTSSPWKALRKGVPFCFRNGIKVLYDLQAVTFIFLAEGECLHPTILRFSCVCTEQTFV